MTRKSHTVRTTLMGVRRLTNSVNGNPRFVLETTDGDYTTQSDAACSYEVTNFSNRAPLLVELEVTRSLRVFGISEAS